MWFSYSVIFLISDNTNKDRVNTKVYYIGFITNIHAHDFVTHHAAIFVPYSLQVVMNYFFADLQTFRVFVSQDAILPDIIPS